MNAQTLYQGLVRHVKARPRLVAGVGLAVLALIAAMVFARPSSPGQAISYYEVKRGDLLVSIVEGGTVEAVNQVSIRSEVEGHGAHHLHRARRQQREERATCWWSWIPLNRRTQVNLQQINVEKAQFALVQADAATGNSEERGG